MQALQDQHVLILGLGHSGLSMARWCASQGARVTVADTRAQPPQRQALAEALPQAQFVHAAFDAGLLQGGSVRAVFVSPGLSPAQTQELLAAAQAMGLWCGSELTLFAHALAALRASVQYQPHVLAVTGTNGKTTVTSLCAHLARWAGKRVAVAGNIGPALLDTLGAALDAQSQAEESPDAPGANAGGAQALPEVWVLELSSFQLHLPSAFEPSAATVLNLTQDHLDWHADMAHYSAAKARIFGQRGLMVLNRDDAGVMAMLPPAKGTRGARAMERDYVSFGSDAPQRPGDFGLEEVNGMLWLVRANVADETRRARRDGAEELHIQRLMPADALRIRGRHNACNALAALALCAAADCALGPILYGLREYAGEPHRVQSVAVLDGVEYFDDSKGTNVGATLAAVTGLGAERRLLLILGGEGKGQDFSVLAPAVARHVRTVLLIGRDAPLLRAALADSGVPLVDAASLEQAVQQAATLAQSGDAVLLSPACASFDMFQDYAHRARVFVDAVRALALAQGSDLEGAP